MFFLSPFNNGSQKRNGDFYNIIDDFFKDDFFPINTFQNNTFRMDVRENDKEYLIEAELPGVKREDIKLEYNDSTLMISVIEQTEGETKNNNYIRRERRMSSMQRGVYLKDVKGDAILAKLEDGILKIIVPKVENPTNRLQIEIK